MARGSVAGRVWLRSVYRRCRRVVALVVSFATGYLRQAWQNIWLLMMHRRVAGLKPLPELTIHDGTGPKLAYGVAIFAGTMVTVWMR